MKWVPVVAPRLEAAAGGSGTPPDRLVFPSAKRATADDPAAFDCTPLSGRRRTLPKACGFAHTVSVVLTSPPRTDDGPESRIIRVACWPASGSHDYLTSLYRALRPHGVEVSVDGAPFENRFLEARRGAFDVIHLHWPEHLWGGHDKGRLAKARGLIGFWRYLQMVRRLRIPLVWTAHDLSPHHRASFVDEIGYRLAEWFADVIICHDTRSLVKLKSRAHRRSTVIMKCKMGNLALVWPSPSGREAHRSRLGIGSDQRLLVCGGGMLDYKGFDLAIRAMRHLDDRYRLIIAGDAPNPAYLAELRDEIGNDARARIIAGWLSTQDLVDLMDAADCVLLPYRRITGSAVLLAAATVGRAVVASDLPFFRETLAAEPLAGVLCDAADPAKLAAAVGQFFSGDVDERHRAAKRLSAEHSWESIVPPIADCIRAATSMTG